VVEVVVKLRFITPCLGKKRSSSGKPDEMLKDTNGNIIFLPTWWDAILTYGSQAMSKHQKEIKKIEWDPLVDGVPKNYRRYYTEKDFKDHEAFLKGQVIGVRAMLPNTIPLEDFQRMLELAGRYKGMSPYGYDKGFGRFEVVEVSRAK